MPLWPGPANAETGARGPPLSREAGLLLFVQSGYSDRMTSRAEGVVPSSVTHQPQTRCALSVMGTSLPTLMAVACQPVPPLCEKESTGIMYCEVVTPSSEKPPAPGRNLPAGQS